MSRKNMLLAIGLLLSVTSIGELSAKNADATSANNEGVRKMVKGQIEEAISSFDKAIESDPKYITGYSNRSLCFYKLGKLDQALDDCHTMISINAKEPSAYSRMARVEFDKGMLAEALQHSNTAIELFPYSWETFELRSAIKAKAGDNDGATIDMQTAISLKRAHEKRLESQKKAN